MRVAVALSMIISILSLAGVCYLGYQYHELYNNRYPGCKLIQEGKKLIQEGKKFAQNIVK